MMFVVSDRAQGMFKDGDEVSVQLSKIVSVGDREIKLFSATQFDSTGEFVPSQLSEPNIEQQTNKTSKGDPMRLF